MKVIKELMINIDKKDLLDFLKSKMPDYDFADILCVDGGGFESDGCFIVTVKLN